MTKLECVRLKNAMLIGNIASNALAVIVVFYIIFRHVSGMSPELTILVRRLESFFDPSCLIIAVVLTVIYELPIRRYLDLVYKGKEIPPEFITLARRRILNEPYFLIVLDFCL